MATAVLRSEHPGQQSGTQLAPPIDGITVAGSEQRHQPPGVAGVVAQYGVWNRQGEQGPGRTRWATACPSSPECEVSYGSSR